MGIFSLFGKKNSQPTRKSTEQESSQQNRELHNARAIKTENEQVQRKAAHETAMKIDAIESEMSSEFVKPLPFSGNTMPGPSSQFMDTEIRAQTNENLTLEETSTLPDLIGSSTAFLLGAETIRGQVAMSTSEAAPAIEEAAILFANNQTNLIEPILLNAIAEDAIGSTPLVVWGMLFDLYQITGKHASFEHLSIEYANKFEISPPAWIDSNTEAQSQPDSPRSNVTPGVAFSGKLDATSIKQLERLKNIAEMSKVIKLEFARVTAVDAVGCGLLLSILQKLQKSGHNLILVGASELVEKIREILMVGRRDETESPWLLLLELLRLLNRESEFEETSIDYCITFEISPPSFTSPQNKVITATDESVEPEDTDNDHFMMPVVIDASTTNLVQNITTHAHTHNPVILDCARLTRMDFNAAGQLFGGLTPLISTGKSFELHNANHFIVALCHVMGFSELVRIVPRKI